MAKNKNQTNPKSKPNTPKTATQSEKKQPADPMRRWIWIGVAVVMGAVFLAFGSALSHDFVSWDDHEYLYENPLLLNPTSKSFWTLGHQIVSLNYHPITMWSLWLNSKIFGAEAGPIIGVNILIHSVNTALVFLLVWHLSARRWGVALFTALLFGIHPLRVESVVWVSERKDVLYTLFFLLACLTYLRYIDNAQKKWLWYTFALFIVACLSKATAVVLPVVLLLLDYWKGRKFNTATILEKAPLFAGSLLFGLIALNIQGGGNFHGVFTTAAKQVDALSPDAFPLMERIRYGGYGYMMYFIKFFVPTELCTFYPYPVDIGKSGSTALYQIGPLFMVGTLAFAAWSATRTRLFLFGFGFFFVTIALVLQFISVGVVIMADRYSYLPSIGLLFMLCYGVEVLLLKDNPRYTQIFRSILAAFTFVCFSLTVQQVKTWKNSETLWKNVIQYYPTADSPRESLGNWYGKNGQMDSAAVHLNVAVSDGCKRGFTYGALANCLAYQMSTAKDTVGQQAKRTKIIAMYDQAIQLDPNNGAHYYNKAVTIFPFDPTGAISSLEKAYQIDKTLEIPYHLYKGMCFINLGKNQEAYEDLNKAVTLSEAIPPKQRTPQINERTLMSYRNRGVARFNLQDKAGGLNDLQKALALNPKDPTTQMLLQRVSQ